MGKIIDWIMSDGDWEKMQRIQLYKKLKERLSEEDIDELIDELKKKKKGK